MSAAAPSSAPEHNEARGRQPRAEMKKTERRRRKAGTLNRMASFKLDVFDDSQLDLKNFVYRWVNDEESRLRQATKMDDYDFVPTADIEGFDPDTTDSESSERVRMLTGKDGHGNPTYTYLVRKPREFWEEDQEAMVRAREDMMAGRVYQAELGEEETLDHAYVTPDTQLGGATRRRQGPITRN